MVGSTTSLRAASVVGLSRVTSVSPGAGLETGVSGLCLGREGAVTSISSSTIAELWDCTFRSGFFGMFAITLFAGSVKTKLFNCTEGEASRLKTAAFESWAEMRVSLGSNFSFLRGRPKSRVEAGSGLGVGMLVRIFEMGAMSAASPSSRSDGKSAVGLVPELDGF